MQLGWCSRNIVSHRLALIPRFKFHKTTPWLLACWLKMVFSSWIIEHNRLFMSQFCLFRFELLLSFIFSWECLDVRPGKKLICFSSFKKKEGQLSLSWWNRYSICNTKELFKDAPDNYEMVLCNARVLFWQSSASSF